MWQVNGHSCAVDLFGGRVLAFPEPFCVCVVLTPSGAHRLWHLPLLRFSQVETNDGGQFLGYSSGITGAPDISASF